MRKTLALVIGLALSLGMAAPVLAQPCEDLVAFARIQATGEGTAQGSALVLFDGTVEKVTFDSTIKVDGVHQTWHFADGHVEVVESPDPQPLGGPVTLIDSEVEVQGDSSGNWHYDGRFNSKSLRGTFVVTGDLCP